MLKFVVVLFRREDLSVDEFRRYLRETHGPMAEKLPGLKRYVHNYVVLDPNRKHPGWDAIVELYFENWESMETAWRSPEGLAATGDLKPFCDLTRTTWSVVEEKTVRD